MNQRILETLEYDKIKQAIAKFILTDKGRALLNDVEPLSDVQKIRQRLAETDDGFHLYRMQEGMPLPHLREVTADLKRLDVDITLTGTELANVMKILLATKNMQKFFAKLQTKQVQFHRLSHLVDELTPIPEVLSMLSRSINEQGEILDSASRKLTGLKRHMTALHAKIGSKVHQYTNGKNAKHLNNTEATVRDGRYVIPIEASAKNIFGGVVHDQSASGETLFVEPKGLVALNNDRRRSQVEIRQEKQRILSALSKSLRPYQREIISDVDLLGQLDLINAKAHYAYLRHDTLPTVSDKNEVNLKQAKHPLINPHKVVGNDLRLGKKYQAMVITGPNTGGKTITIKTLGLLQLMGQSGFFIPANEGSQIGVFDNIFADIGDQQSIEQSLSTFSSHMDNIVRILKHMTAKSLILLDEVGAGTDPNEGAALAISILDAIGKKGATVVATTHYPELKNYGYNHPGTINASMEFDLNTLKPTYHLLLGVPGQSNGLNIAQRLGLSPEIIQEAHSLTSSESENLNHMITELAQQTRQARHASARLHNELAEATSIHHKLAHVFLSFQQHQSDLNQAAKEKANVMVNETKKRANRIIADLHQKQKQLAHAPVKENELMDAKGKLNSLQQRVKLRKNPVVKQAHVDETLHPGDDVYVKPYGQRGVLIEPFNKKTWKVQIGILKMKLKATDLKKIHHQKQAPSHVYTMVDRSASNVLPAHLDLRGERYQAAMHKLDHYIDAALLAGYAEVTIIHGKGTGVLRKGVKQYLSQNSRVAHFQYSPPNAGGDGSTIVKLK